MCFGEIIHFFGGELKKVFSIFQVLSLSHPVSPHCEVFSLMKIANFEDACRGSRYLKLHGQLVCGSGFRKMMGIGKGRFSKMGKALRSGEAYCPYDARYIARGSSQPSEKYQKVYSYLLEMYANVAEFIPDGLNSNKRPRHAGMRLDKPGMNRDRIKHLPHASISDYHRQCQAAKNDASISRKLFSTVPCWETVNCFLFFSMVFFV